MQQFPPQPPTPYVPPPPTGKKNLGGLIALTILYVLLVIPSMGAAMASVMMVAADTGDAPAIFTVIGYTLLLGSGTFPVVALAGVVVGWIQYARQQYKQALIWMFVPMFNIALTLLALGLFSIIGQ